jgi:hypothetical protein
LYAVFLYFVFYAVWFLWKRLLLSVSRNLLYLFISNIREGKVVNAQNYVFYFESDIAKVFPFRPQGLVTIFFYPSTTLKKTQGRNLKCQIFIQHFFKIVLHLCLDLIRHNIGTHLKLNKYIFDISIPFCHHLYLSAILKQCFTQNLQSAGLPSIMLTCQYEVEFLRAIWLVGYF